MMWIIKMFFLRWKSCSRKPYAWAFVVVAILASFIPVLTSQYDSVTKLPIGLVNEDGNVLSYKFEKYMDDYDKNLIIYKFDREKSMRYLALGRLDAVYICNSGFTRQITQGEYEGLITMYTVPASSDAQALSETIISSAITVWLEERSLIELRAFLKSEGLPFTTLEQANVRNKFDNMIHNGSTVSVVSHIPAPAKTGGQYSVLLSSSAWFSSFVALFIIVSSGWIIESRRKELGERMLAAGIHPLASLTGSALAIISISMIGWIIADIAASYILHVGVLVSIRLILPVLLYMAGMMGITLTIASILDRTEQLILIAPVFTLTQGVLCGMLITLPDWAGTLVYISDILPGRWFMLGADSLLHGGPIVYVLWQTLCAILWIALGIFSVQFVSRRAKEAV